MNFDIIDLVYIVYNKLPKKRFIHTIGVVKTAEKLAEIYGAPKDNIIKAALLHDICKYTSMNYMKKICEEKFSDDLTYEDLKNDEILHGFMAAYWVENKLNIKDEEILNAIKYHTIGSKKMSISSKIIYIADGIEPGRNYDTVDKLRKLAFEDINLAIYTEIEEKEKYLKSLGKKLHKNTVAMREELLPLI